MFCMNVNEILSLLERRAGIGFQFNVFTMCSQWLYFKSNKMERNNLLLHGYILLFT